MKSLFFYPTENLVALEVERYAIEFYNPVSAALKLKLPYRQAHIWNIAIIFVSKENLRKLIKRRSEVNCV